jgi:hypothetical protein
MDKAAASQLKPSNIQLPFIGFNWNKSPTEIMLSPPNGLQAFLILAAYDL